MEATHASIHVVGIGDDGCQSLTSSAFNAISKAQVLVGGQRQLEFFHDHPAQKIVFKSPMSKALNEVRELSFENTVCILASGDPLFYGIGSLLTKKLPLEQLNFIPAPSSVQLAFAKLAKPWNNAKTHSLHGRPIQGLVSRIRHDSLVAIFTDSDNCPERVAQYLLEQGDINWNIWVLLVSCVNLLKLAFLDL